MASNWKRLRGRIKADNMGQGEGPTVMHWKRVTSELHDSYFHLMIKHSISKIELASNDYITQLSLTSQLSWRSDEVGERCGKESHTRPKGPSGSPDELGSREDVDKMQ